MDTSPEALTKEQEADILKAAHERYDMALEAWGEHFREARKVLNFLDGQQWDADLRRAREASGLPCLTIDHLNTFLTQITNEGRQNTPSIQINPKDDQASEEVAKVKADHIRSIERNSCADVAYDTAGWYAATTGLGFFRVKNEYESADSFQQKLVIEQIEDPETCMIDPAHRTPTGRDAEWCLITKSLTKEQYNREFPSSKLAETLLEKGWTAQIGNKNWIKANEVIIAEYYWKDYKKETLYEVGNALTGTVEITTTKPSDSCILLVDGQIPQPGQPVKIVERSEVGERPCVPLFTILNERPVQTPTVKWAKLNDAEVLECTEWPGSLIPVIAVKGEETYVEGKRKLRGAVKAGMDSQRSLNYFYSIAAELVSLSPKAPFIGDIRQFRGYEDLWGAANNQTAAYLPYNHIDGVPPPSRTAVEPAIQSSLAMVHEAKENLKGAFGIFDASIGKQDNAVSGKAILARTEQSHVATYHYYDNLVRAVELCGCILLEAMPVIYNEQREIQVVAPNGKVSTTTINDGQTDYSKGKYGVVVEAGPSFATKRQESVERMLTLMETYPNSAPLIADLAVQEMDWPGAQEVAKRLAFALPPEIQQAEAQNGDLSPEKQAQMAISQVKVLSQQLQALNAHAQHVEQERDTALEENKILKEKSAVELEKASLDAQVKREELELDELKTELEYKAKMVELGQSQQQLDIEKAKLGIQTVEAAADLNESIHDKEIEHLDRMVEHRRAENEKEDKKVEGVDMPVPGDAEELNSNTTLK